MDNALGADALTSIPWEGRAIMLVDLDAFFASVEQLDHPGWRGKPVIVGGDADRRGVVSTASYEARAFGVHSAMPSSTAARLCPDAIWTRGHYARYKEVSNQVMDVLRDETPFVQQVSIDEAFIDVTPGTVSNEHPIRIAERIQQRVDELGVSCSIGLGTTKAVAKLASDMDKPRGLTVVLPGSEANFMWPQPIRKMSGIGPSAEKRLVAMGIKTLGDLAAADDTLVIDALGKAGATMLERARFLENDRIEQDDKVKSVSNETSFAEDLTDREDIEAAIFTMTAKVTRRMRKKGLEGSVVSLRVRYADRETRSTQRQLPNPTDNDYTLRAYLLEMLDDLWQQGMSIRLVGVAMSGFAGEEGSGQLSMFDDDAMASDYASSSRRRLLEATDAIKDKFGEGALRFGREFRLDDAGTGTIAK